MFRDYSSIVQPKYVQEYKRCLNSGAKAIAVYFHFVFFFYLVMLVCRMQTTTQKEKLCSFSLLSFFGRVTLSHIQIDQMLAIPRTNAHTHTLTCKQTAHAFTSDAQVLFLKVVHYGCYFWGINAKNFTTNTP